MAFCSTCGAENAPGSFCSNCGEKVSELKAPAAANPSGAAQSPTGSSSKTNVLAIVSLVASLIGIFSYGLGGVAGVVCGHIARRQIKVTNEAGSGLALAGIIVGYVTIGFAIAGLLLLAVITSIGNAFSSVANQ